jgi:hypothetical protein
MKIKLALSLAAFGLSICGQSQVLDPSFCVGGLTTAPNCDFWASKKLACHRLRGTAAAQCYCPQTVLNAIAG